MTSPAPEPDAPEADRGYLIVRRAEVAWRLAEETGLIDDEKASSLDFLDLSCYSGIDRAPLTPLTGPDPDYLQEHIDWWREEGIDVDSNQRARIYQGQLCQDDQQNVHLGGLVADLSQARRVHALVDAPDDWDVIGINRQDLRDSETVLGYDAASWGGEFKSLIWYCATASYWSIPDAREWLELLNDNLLFDDPQHARDFAASLADRIEDASLPVRIDSTLGA